MSILNYASLLNPALKEVMKVGSKLRSLPVIDFIVKKPALHYSQIELEGFKASQELAYQCAREIAKLIRPGWTEIQTSRMMETYLRDEGVENFFHHPFVWFGDRTRFDNAKKYAGFLPTKRVIQEGEAYILDVAPIYKGFISDIGYSGALSDSDLIKDSVGYLKSLRDRIPALFEEVLTGKKSGGEVCREIIQEIQDNEFEAIHCDYPLSVLGHRVFPATQLFSNMPNHFKILNFDWQSYWELLSRGLFGQLLNEHFEGDIRGLWAIEPHLGVEKDGKRFGVKFEEILVVEQDKIYWLENGEHFQV